MAISDRYKDLRSAQFDKKRLWVYKVVYFTPDAKAEIPYQCILFVDPTDMKPSIDMHGYPLGFSLSPFAFPRYPPALGVHLGTNPALLKEKMIREDATFSAKLHDFHKMYLRHASGLLDMSSNAFLPRHPVNIRATNDVISKEEHEKLRKENAELKKRIEQLKSKTQI